MDRMHVPPPKEFVLHRRIWPERHERRPMTLLIVAKLRYDPAQREITQDKRTRSGFGVCDEDKLSQTLDAYSHGSLLAEEYHERGPPIATMPVAPVFCS